MPPSPSQKKKKFYFQIIFRGHFQSVMEDESISPASIKQIEDLMDDDHPVNGDPMLYSTFSPRLTSIGDSDLDEPDIRSFIDLGLES